MPRFQSTLTLPCISTPLSIALLLAMAVLFLPATGMGFSHEVLFTLTGEASGDAFGSAVAPAGDFNGDGYPDFIVGAQDNGAGGTGAGRAYVFYGGPDADNVPDVVLTGAASDAFGLSVAGIGDVNEDGFDDVIVGAPFSDAAGDFAGRAYVYFGGAPADDVADLILSGEAEGDNLGMSVSGDGDVNGDGHPDFAVGARYFDAGMFEQNKGRVYVYFGGPDLSTTPDLTITGSAEDVQFGTSLSLVGDVNGDGFDDLLASVLSTDTGTNRAGAAYLYFGGLNMDTVPDLTITGQDPNDHLGFRVAAARDYNADGYADFLVTAAGDFVTGSVTSKVYMYLGGPNPDMTPDLILQGEDLDDWFGVALGSAGDVDGDGYDDFLVGAHTSGALDPITSKAYLYLGGSTPNTDPGLVLHGPSADWLGYSVAGAGDIDGDGRDDFLVGAVHAGLGGEVTVHSVYPYRVLDPNGGETWVRGRSERVRWKGADLADVAVSVDAGLSWTLVGEGVGGDPVNTIHVVAPDQETDHALVRVVLTGRSATKRYADKSDAVFRIVPPGDPPAVVSETVLTVDGGTAGDNLGYSVAAVGDVSGDGREDFVVCAPYEDAGGSGAGQAYLYLGGSDPGQGPALVFTGAAASDALGYAVAGGGDFDGDGYPDLVLSAPYNDAAGSNAGAVYLHRGGPGMDAAADFIFPASAVGENFGLAVALVGDVNRDGADDLLVGAERNDGSGTNAGQAYLYLGGPGADTVADLILPGEATGDQFGCAVAGPGDLNGDGYDDFLVGAEGAEGQGSLTGRVYVFFGGAVLDGVPDLLVEGRASGESLGSTVAAAGDVDGDGHPDFLTGAPYNDLVGTDAGAVYVFRGGPGLDAIPDFTFVGEAAGDLFGSTITGGVDLNGDGFTDPVIGAERNDAGGTNAGRAYVFFGGPDADAAPDVALNGEAANDYFGSALAVAGDLDGDGRADVLAGAKYCDHAGSHAGRAYVYALYCYRLRSPNGGESLVAGTVTSVAWAGSAPADVALSIDGGVSWSTLAPAVGRYGENIVEVNLPAQTSDDALFRVTRAGETPDGANSDRSDGLFAIFPPARPVANVVGITPTGSSSGENLGRSVSGAGDVNGDGFADVIAGAPYNDLGGASSGAAFVYFGGPLADEIADLTIPGETADDRLGESVSGVGDFNGDGYDDFLVGAAANDGGGSSAGRAYLFYGGPSVDAMADLVITGTAGDQLGCWVAGAGDVNGDGYADVVVGTRYGEVSVTNSGTALVYFGGPSADAVADWVLEGEGGNDQFGTAVECAGDVNGDGYDDLVVGAAYNDGPGSNFGRAYLFFGGASPDTIADLVFDGEAASDLFGQSVDGAGDVNGDGYADIVVGAKENDAAATSAGRAYVYLGGPNADALADLIIDGEADSDDFGWPVVGVGDVNRDGFADFAVGASNSDGGGSNAGRVYVFFGGPDMDPMADAVMTGEAVSDYFGISAAGAGDVDGDGFDDVVVGAVGHNAAFADVGRVYVLGFNRFHLVSPAAGETWNVGAAEEISWLGAEPADVWLSVDGGNSYSLLTTDAGGAALSAVRLTVPHQPTRFAKIKLTPSDPSVVGSATTDSLFTIEASIALLNLRAAPVDGGGVLLSWETDPGPEDLAGYKVERSPVAGDSWRVLATRVRETEYLDTGGGPGMQYRLSGINGLGEELLLGETALTPRATLAAWPLPYRSGDLALSFATFGGQGGGVGLARVAIYDLQGRLVRTIADGSYEAGYQVATWNGRDESGRAVPSGVYFIRSSSAGVSHQLKLIVVR